MTDIEKILINELKTINRKLDSQDSKLDSQDTKLDLVTVIVTENKSRSTRNESDIKKIFNRSWAMFALFIGSVLSLSVAIILNVF
jgi:hypothetical protein